MVKRLQPRYFGLIAVVLTILGLFLAVWFYYLDVGQYNYALTIGPPQNQIYIEASNTFDSIMIFIGGAMFSTGLSMIFALLQPKSSQ